MSGPGLFSVAHVALEPLDLALTEPFGIASGAQTRVANVLVRVTLEGGAEGLGEAAPFPAVSGETQSSTMEALRAMAPHVVGRDARSIRSIASALFAAMPHAPAARAGLEMALFDAVGRALGEPSWARFGGAGLTLQTDLTLVTGTAEATALAARAAMARGIRTLKVKVGALSPLADAERMLAVAREAPEATLLADANAAWTADEALVFLGELERLRVPLELLEQPVAADDLVGLARVQERTSALVCADESARSAADVVELARRRAVRAVNVKTQKTGVIEALDVLAVARAAGLQVMIGGMVESVLSMSFSACLAAGRAEFVDLDTPMFIAAHPFVGGYEQRGAELDLSGIRAGHGVRLRS